MDKYNKVTTKHETITTTHAFFKVIYLTLVVMTRKLNSTIKYDPRTSNNSKSNVTLATCNNPYLISPIDIGINNCLYRNIGMCTHCKYINKRKDTW